MLSGIRGDRENGILPLKDRGVFSLDQQYNGCNFEYYIERAKNSFARYDFSSVGPKMKFWVVHIKKKIHQFQNVLQLS